MMKPSRFTALLCVIVFICPRLSAQDSPQARQLISQYFASHKDHSRQSATFEYEVIMDHKDPSSGIRSVQALQKINGIYVLEGILSLNYGHYGRFHAIDQFTLIHPAKRSPQFAAEDAVRIAMAYHNMPQQADLKVKERSIKEDQHTVFARNEATAGDIIARLMYINHKTTGELILTWEVQTHTADRQNYWITYIDATSGVVLSTEDKVLHCSFGEGLVYDASPEEQMQLDAQHHAMHMRSAENWDTMIAQRIEKSANDD